MSAVSKPTPAPRPAVTAPAIVLLPARLPRPAAEPPPAAPPPLPPRWPGPRLRAAAPAAAHRGHAPCRAQAVHNHPWPWWPRPLPQRETRDQRLARTIAEAGRGDCSKGQFLGGGMGLSVFHFGWPLSHRSMREMNHLRPTLTALAAVVLCIVLALGLAPTWPSRRRPHRAAHRQKPNSKRDQSVMPYGRINELMRKLAPVRRRPLVRMDWKVDAEKSRCPSRRCAWPSRRTRAITPSRSPRTAVSKLPLPAEQAKSAEVANQHRQRADGGARQPGAEPHARAAGHGHGAAADAPLNPAQDRAAALVFALALPRHAGRGFARHLGRAGKVARGERPEAS